MSAIICPIREFLVLRRGARMMHKQLESARVDIAANKRETLRLTGGAFNGHRLERLRIQLAGLELERRRATQGQRNVGELLVCLAPYFDEATTFAQRMELINANAMDVANTLDGRGLLALLVEHTLEDSAERRRTGHYGPLATAIAPIVAGARVEAQSAIRCASTGSTILRIAHETGGGHGG